MHEKERKPSNTTGSTRQVAPPLTGETALLEKDQVIRRILYLRTDQGVIGDPCLCPSDRLKRRTPGYKGMTLVGANAYPRQMPFMVVCKPISAAPSGGDPVLTIYILSRQQPYSTVTSTLEVSVSPVTYQFANLRC